MKKVALGILTFFVLTVGAYLVWWNLPFTINRSSDIKLGEEIIKNIESYQKQNSLPDNNDWETLRKFGFKDKIDFLQPEYRKLDDNNFELIYVEGFDGPYLMWSSTERKWKEGYPNFEKPTLLKADREVPLGWVYLTIYKDSTFEFTLTGIRGDGDVYKGKVKIGKDSLFFEYSDSIPRAGKTAIYNDEVVAYIDGEYPERVNINMTKLMK